MTEPASSATPEPNAVTPTRPRRRTRAIVWIIAPFMVLVLAALALPLRSKPAQHARQIACQKNLHQLGVGCRAYAAAHGGKSPSSWEQLNLSAITNRQDGDDLVKLLHCPAARHEVGTSANLDLWADYRLLPDRSTNDSPRTVLVIEPLANHQPLGAFVLYVNGDMELWKTFRVLGLPP